MHYVMIVKYSCLMWWICNICALCDKYEIYVHYVIEYEIYDIVHYMLSMRFYGMNYASL